MRTIFIFLFSVSVFSSFAQFEPVPIAPTTEHIYIDPIYDRILINPDFGNPIWLDKDLVTMTSLVLPNSGQMGRGFSAPDSTFFVLLTNGLNLEFYASIDTGKTWQLRYTNNSFAALASTMFDNKHGIMYGHFNNMLQTSDGGNTWTLLPSIYKPNDIRRIDTNTAIMRTLGGASITYDKANTWKVLFNSIGSGCEFLDVALIGSDSVIACFQNQSGGRYIATSIDTGSSVQYRYIGPDTLATGIALHKGAIYMTGYYFPTLEGVVLKSTDFGQSFTMYNSHIKKIFTQIHFVDDSTALVAGREGALYKWRVDTQGWPTSATELTSASKQVELYPNPAQGMLYIRHAEGKLKILYSVVGQPLLSTTADAVDVSHLAKGIYYLQCHGAMLKVVLE